MTMHLAHPALTTTGRRRGRVKWASAQHKQQHQELQTQWQQKMQELAKLSPAAQKNIKKPTVALSSLSPRIPPGRNTTRHIPSVTSTHTGAVSSRPAPVYTGDQVLGIAVQHKSCLQPIFNAESAVDSAHMRR